MSDHAEAIAIWQAMYAGGRFETAIPAATNRTLRVLLAYLCRQEPSMMMKVVLAMIENEIITRFCAQDDRQELDAQFTHGEQPNGEGFL